MALVPCIECKYLFKMNNFPITRWAMKVGGLLPVKEEVTGNDLPICILNIVKRRHPHDCNPTPYQGDAFYFGFFQRS